MASIIAAGCGSDPLPAVGDAGAVDAATAAPATLPWGTDLQLGVSGLAGYEGLGAFVRLQNTARNETSPWWRAQVRGGRFDVLWPGGFDRDTFGLFAWVYVDRDGDGACTPARDPAWNLFVNNSFMAGRVVAEIGVDAPGAGRVECRELP